MYYFKASIRVKVECVRYISNKIYQVKKISMVKEEDRLTEFEIDIQKQDKE